MAKPSRTTNPLHFEDLDPRRFEDLMLALVYRQRPWEDIHHDGRTGADAGVDIRAVERVMDGSLRHWWVQCKRYQSFTASDSRTAIDEALARATLPPDVFILALGCDVTLATRNAFETYAEKMGIESAILWTSAKLETMLYAEYPDLLFTYFGLSLARRERSREVNLKRGLAMKRKLARLFPPKCGHPDVIIRSIDDEMYPEVDAAPKGRMSSWIKPEFGGHYHNGIELLLGVQEIIVDRENGNWAMVDYNVPEIRRKGNVEKVVDHRHYAIVKVFRIGRVPFRNICEIDEDGDEFYRHVHVYCRYADAGVPYEEILYRETDGYTEFFSETEFPFAEAVGEKK